MDWQYYRGKQAKALVGCNFLDNNENEGKKVKLCFKMVNGLTFLCYLERVVIDYWINYKCLDN